MTDDDEIEGEATPRDIPREPSQGFAAAATVERHHSEVKARFEKIEKRIAKLELGDAAGAERFKTIDEKLTDIKAKVEGPRWWVLLAIVAPLALASGGALIKIGQYPDPGDVRSTTTRLIQLEADLRLQRILLDTYRLHDEGRKTP